MMSINYRRLLVLGLWLGIVSTGLGSLQLASATESQPDQPGPGESEAAYQSLFIPESPPAYDCPTMVGVITTLESDGLAALPPAEQLKIREQFRSAYLRGQLDGLALTGVLGGDRVHSWQPLSPGASGLADSPPLAGAYVQNWRDNSETDNAWGLPGLVIAARPWQGEELFIVEGLFVDIYGQGLGLAGANGITGYGSPVSPVFPLADGLAQRFEAGVIIIDKDGTATFQAEAPPAWTADNFAEAADGFDDRAAGASETAQPALLAAWEAAVNAGRFPGLADNPVFRLSSQSSVLSEPDTLEVQSFDGANWALVFHAEAGARIIDRPVIELFLAEASLAAAVERYGFPLTDPRYQFTTWSQRFSRGLIKAERP